MFDDEEDFYLNCGMVALICLLIIGPAIGAIIADRNNNATVAFCKELCIVYDKRPQCLACCEKIGWRYEDEKECYRK